MLAGGSRYRSRVTRSKDSSFSSARYAFVLVSRSRTPSAIITDGDGIGPYTRVHAVGCLPASACLYHCQVMNARPQGRGAGHAYLVGGSPGVEWLSTWVPPGLVRLCRPLCSPYGCEINVAGYF
jgi:hypothetical protein